MSKKQRDELIKKLVEEDGLTVEEATDKVDELENEGERHEPEDGTGNEETDSGERETEGSEDPVREKDLLLKNEDLSHRLFTALVKLDGRLADPEDLPYDPALLDDEDALEAAITALIRAKPGLRSQRVLGNIGQGKRGNSVAPKPDLISIIRGM